MLSYIWKYWWRNKGKLLLLLVSVLLIFSSASTLIGMTETKKGNVEDELQKRWKASYDIVVRHPDSRSITEEQGLLEPNYLSGMEGGITLEQLEQIKKIDNVKIAAPIAMIGYIGNHIELEKPILETGIYRNTYYDEMNNGFSKEKKFEYTSYYVVGKWFPEDIVENIYPGIMTLSYGSVNLLAAIDPEAEAALVGLDEATILNDNSRYFNERDFKKEENSSAGSNLTPIEGKDFTIPVLVNNLQYEDGTYVSRYEKLDIPFDQDHDEIMKEIVEKGGHEYLDTVKGKTVKTYQYHKKEIHQSIVDKILDRSDSKLSRLPTSTYPFARPGEVLYKKMESPYKEKWPNAYDIEVFIPTDDDDLNKESYRQYNSFEEEYLSQNWNLDFIGVFDPKKLNLSKDPFTGLPMETYFPAKAELALDGEKKPVNPSVELSPTNDSFGYLTKPPLLLTTIDTATSILGDEAISAIRIKVNGIETINEESEMILQQVASDIESKTGLIADITLGSSLQNTLVHLPGVNGYESIGWLQQPWIKLGTSMEIFQEVQVGSFATLLIVLLVGTIYILTNSILRFLARKREYATLLALGWKLNMLARMFYLEAIILGGVVALLNLGIMFVFTLLGASITMFLILCMAVIPLLLFLLGASITTVLSKRVEPYDAIKREEITGRTMKFKGHSILGMSIKNMLGKRTRSIFSILSISVPSGLLVLFLFASLELNGVLNASLLGEYITIKISTEQYVAIIVAFILAIFTATEIMWHNILEQQSSFAIMKAIGWKNNGIRKLVLFEGLLTGICAGAIGLIIGLAFIYIFYGSIPYTNYLLILIGFLVPVVTGLISAIFPAEKALRLLPNESLNRKYDSSEKQERKSIMQLVFAGAGLICIFVTFLVFPAGRDVEQTNISNKASLTADFQEEKEKPSISQSGAQADYQMDLLLKNDDFFEIETNVRVSNNSTKIWSEIGFYFVPNTFTEENKPNLLENSAQVNIHSITQNGKEVDYTLEDNILMITPLNKIRAGEQADITIVYEMKIPENGNRLSKVQSNYYLAQWYPMIGFFDDEWRIHPYDIRGESYDTSYGKYDITYQLPDSYLVASSAEDGEIGPKSEGKLSGEGIKDFYIALLDPSEWTSNEVALSNQSIKLYFPKTKVDELEYATKVAQDSLDFFEKKIGALNTKELDLIANDNGMEYPYIVEIPSEGDNLEHTIVHEIAHQWFYHTINNDPFEEAWLDEGLTEFVTAMYLAEKHNSNEYGFQNASKFASLSSTNNVLNKAISDFQQNEYAPAIYGKVPLLLREFFEKNGGADEAWSFLSAYYNEFQYKYVDTKAFASFFTERYENEEEFLSTWLDY
ncbi:MAG: FtsX-like permease family protein [Psychrobacillus psychrodurans]